MAKPKRSETKESRDTFFSREGKEESKNVPGKLRVVTNNVILTAIGKPENGMTSIEKMQISESGISKKSLEELKTKAGLDYDQLSQILNVARATLINKKRNEKFRQDLSEKIVGLAEIYSYGYEVFEDQGKFNDWIFKPNHALGKKAPFDLLHNAYGREEVRNLIGRIDYGLYS